MHQLLQYSNLAIMFYMMNVCENGLKKQIVVPFAANNSTWSKYWINLVVSSPYDFRTLCRVRFTNHDVLILYRYCRLGI